MTKINVPIKEQVDDKAKAIFDNLEKMLGMIPNLYATMGYSSDVLAGYLQYSSSLGSSSFNKKEIELIKLAVSEVNGCNYCVAAHTVLAKMNGFSEEETIGIRLGQIQDSRYYVIVKTAQEIARERGKLSDITYEQFYALGFDTKALVDLIAVVNAVSFTNFLHRATDVPIDFPAAPQINRDAA
ncbi:carboxymuconolactone decarboxylase family protein [Puteibacter caeruleilacunae]|nr:carboxymuconolactone decarboxylase family protein [Puteibacter caeruleilacunae]